MSLRLRLILACAGAAALAGCAVGPNYAKPDIATQIAPAASSPQPNRR